MRYKYHSRRSVRRLARKSRRNFLITLVIITILAYSTLTWILPNFIGGLGFVKNVIKPSQKKLVQSGDTLTLAPPVLNIPFEATNTAQIDIKGFSTPNLKIKLYMDDDPKQTVDVSSDGSFTFKNVALTLGTNNIYGKTLNEKGNESLPSKLQKIIFDNEKPFLSINEPEDNEQVLGSADKTIQGGDKKVRISGKTDPGANVFINDTQIILDKDGNFNTDQLLNEGDNTISIKAVDSAGNTTEVQRRVNYTP